MAIRASTGEQCKSEPNGHCHDWSQLVATSAVVFRGNVAQSNGGFSIATGAYTGSVRDVIIEGNAIRRSDLDKAMQISPLMVAEPNGTCIVRGNALPAM